MTVRQRNILIYACAAVFAVSGAGALALALLRPAQVALPARSAAKGEQGVGPASPLEDVADQSISLEVLQGACSFDLRKPLFDPSPPAAPVQAESPAASSATAASIRLIGTINEPGHSMAMFLKPDGTVKVCAPGDSIDDAGGKLIVTQIDGMKVTVQWGGQKRLLTLDRPQSGGNAP